MIHTCVRITLLESSSSEPTIDPTDKLFQRLDLLLDPWLCKGVIILQTTQNSGRAANTTPSGHPYPTVSETCVKAQAVSPKLLPVLWGTKESHRTAEWGKGMCFGGKLRGLEHSRMGGQGLMRKAEQPGDSPRPQGTLDHCLFFFFAAQHNFRDLVPQLGIKPMSSGVKTQSPNHWAAREVL